MTPALSLGLDPVQPPNVVLQRGGQDVKAGVLTDVVARLLSNLRVRGAKDRHGDSLKRRLVVVVKGEGYLYDLAINGVGVRHNSILSDR